MKFKEIEGDLIQILKSKGNIIAVHGCNCFCLQASGIAGQFAEHFGTHLTEMEKPNRRGDINKLGNIESKFNHFEMYKSNTIINAYTQYKPGKNLDYNALYMCLLKINHIYKGKTVYFPQIGCGIAGGSWDKVKFMIRETMKDCDVIIVHYKKD